MPQDKYSGGRAAAWGHETAQQVAAAIRVPGSLLAVVFSPYAKRGVLSNRRDS